MIFTIEGVIVLYIALAAVSLAGCMFCMCFKSIKSTSNTGFEPIPVVYLPSPYQATSIAVPQSPIGEVRLPFGPATPLAVLESESDAVSEAVTEADPAI
jgi:hypothetical protein